MRLKLAYDTFSPAASLPCASSLAWTSALVGGITIRDDDLAASMVLFFVLLVFLTVGLLRTYQGRHLLDVLIIFAPTLSFVFCLTVWSALRAHLSNTLHTSSLDAILAQTSLSELVAANGLLSCSPMLLCETTFQVFGLLAKRIAPSGRKWVTYTSYVARLANAIALVMGVVAACDFASYLTAWLDQMKLASTVSDRGVQACSTNVLGRDLTLLPLMADGLLLVVLFVLTVLTISLCLRYRLAAGIVFHVVAIISCLELHFAWKCVRDWSAVQIYLDGDWTKPQTTDGNLEELARRIRKGAEDAMLFYLLGMVPLVLAMVLIYTLDLTAYTNPPPTPALAQDHLTTQFHLVLDPTAPHIELLPTSKTAQADAKKDAAAGKGNAGGKAKDGAAKSGEMYVVKRGWFGGWSVQPAQQGGGWAAKAKMRARRGVQSWVLGWSSDGKGAPAA
ncbi:uncharacterized protein SRS1_12603 [Sporisorium reilianum f. sp. reilianum]|uniref:Uncharacterized protein n=1 Tax=Sporisorium reilianum f. sp. reilianum TaxID=72559 RepID=A0A2N8UA89_9BASI|nr:uncharacterized protein SRS1_12603 [Sporisorium reilianum f. sp. reilianum]